jgi:hypothetical protein
MRLRTLKEKLLPKDTPAYRRRNAREIFLIGLPMVIGVKPTLLSDQKINASLRIKSMHLNRSGRISGGTIMAMADAMGAAGAVINRAPGFSGGTIESKTNLTQIAPRIDLNPDKAAPTREEIEAMAKSMIMQAQAEHECCEEGLEH